MTQTLVTGGSGFIGQHLVAALLAQGHRVRILDLRPPPCPTTGAQYVPGSVLDPERVREALDDVAEVYHLAALPGMWIPRKDDFQAVNYRGTEIMLDAARERGVSRFLHCSTEAILFGFLADIFRRRTDMHHPRRNAGGLHTLEIVRGTASFASGGFRIPCGDCQSDNVDRSPSWKSYAANFDASAFFESAGSNLL